MDASQVFCPNPACVARGKIGEGNVISHGKKRARSALEAHSAFAASSNVGQEMVLSGKFRLGSNPKTAINALLANLCLESHLAFQVVGPANGFAFFHNNHLQFSYR